MKTFLYKQNRKILNPKRKKKLFQFLSHWRKGQILTYKTANSPANRKRLFAIKDLNTRSTGTSTLFDFEQATGLFYIETMTFFFSSFSSFLVRRKWKKGMKSKQLFRWQKTGDEWRRCSQKTRSAYDDERTGMFSLSCFDWLILKDGRDIFR